jgi:hypothetical protein
VGYVDHAQEPTPDGGTGAGEGAVGDGPNDRPHPEGDPDRPARATEDRSPEVDVVDNEHEIDDDKDPLRFNRWMKRSATGAVMTGISLGLREALENKKNQPALMIEASGQPDDPDHPIRLHFDPDSPADSVAVIRRPAEPDDTPPSR